MKAWYTDDQVMAVLDAAADQGITAVWTPCYDRWVSCGTNTRERGGRLKIWIGQPDPMAAQMEQHITTAARNGARAICIQGIRVDEQARADRWDVLRGRPELIKSFGLPAGMANTAPDASDRRGKGAAGDFYHQTLYRPDNYVREGLEESLATIEKLDKPVVAYKALGAGRIMPGDTLPVRVSAFETKGRRLASACSQRRRTRSRKMFR